MGKKTGEIIETGVFASPAAGADSPYELIQRKSGDLIVKCGTSGEEFDVSVLSTPTHSDVDDQRRAFQREIAAWLCTNGPANPQRESASVSEITQALNAEYTLNELAADRQWIQSNDLSKRIPILRAGLDEATRLTIVEFAARIASAGTGVSETDAQFIELLGTGLGISKELVTNTVVQAIQRSSAA